MNPESLHLHIDHLVLDDPGSGRAGAASLTAEIERELMRLFAERDLPESSWAGESQRHFYDPPSAACGLPSASIAEAIHGAVVNVGRTPAQLFKE